VEISEDSKEPCHVQIEKDTGKVLLHNKSILDMSFEVALDVPSLNSGDKNHNGQWKKSLDSPRFRRAND
jgi:hypothetical protein